MVSFKQEHSAGTTPRFLPTARQGAGEMDEKYRSVVLRFLVPFFVSLFISSSEKHRNQVVTVTFAALAPPFQA